MRKFRVLDLFSGIGGFSLAADWMGWETVAFCERESFPRKVLAKHWPGVPIHDDVKKIEEFDQYAGAVELICGGYPCQPFSVAGKQRGAADDRHLWPAMFEIIKRVRPRWVVGENVAGHIKMGLDSVLSDLESEGYTARAFVIPACAVNAQHRRDRVWIVAYAPGNRCNSGSGGRGQRYIPDYINRDATENQQERKRRVSRSWPTVSDAPNAHSERTQIQSKRENSSGEMFGSTGEEWKIGRQELGGQTKPSICRGDDGIPIGMDRTLSELTQPPIINKKKRPPNYTHRIKALGNAIVPQVAYQIFKAIQEAENDIQA